VLPINLFMMEKDDNFPACVARLHCLRLVFLITTCRLLSLEIKQTDFCSSISNRINNACQLVWANWFWELCTLYVTSQHMVIKVENCLLRQ